MIDLFGNEETRLVNIHTHGCDVYIGRAGKGQDGYFGNHERTHDAFTEKKDKILAYKIYFYDRLGKDDEFKRRVHELKNKTLGCFCKPEPCHGDVIIEYLNKLK